MPNSIRQINLSPKHAITFLGFLVTTLGFVTVIQLASGQAPDAQFGAIGVFQLIVFELFIGLNLLPLFGHSFKGTNQIKLNLGIVFLFSFIAIGDYLEIDKLFANLDLQIDLTFALLWFAGGLLLLYEISSRNRNNLALFLVILGLTIHSLLLLNIVFISHSETSQPSILIETLESSSQALIIILFASALLVSLVSPKSVTPDATGSIGKWFSNTLFLAEYSKIGSLAAIGFTNAQFRGWQLFNQNKSFADFYAWQITRKLDKGRAHRTLGAKQFEQDSIVGAVPRHTKASLAERRPNLLTDHIIDLGLKKHHTLVDFGCGSLRVGQPLIEWLEPEKYWGMDVTDRFFTDGLKLIDNKVLTTKKPRLRVISNHSLQEVAQYKPDFVMSIAVLKHVPKNDLNGYFDSVCNLMHDQSILALTFSASETEKRISGKSWSWSKGRIIGLIQNRLPNHSVEITMTRDQKTRNNVDMTYCFIAARPK